MTNPIETRYEALPRAAQLRFLTACLRHVGGAFDRALDESVRASCFAPALAALEAPPAGDVAAQLAQYERALDDAEARDEQDLLAFLVACKTAFQIASGEDEPVKFVLNNLEEVVRTCDPDPDERGMEEEAQLQGRILDALEASDASAVAELESTVLDWQRRWDEG